MTSNTEMPIMVQVDARKLVRITEDHGGWEGGQCVACGENGWLDKRYGYPHGTTNVPQNQLIHEKGCVMNGVLTEDGELNPGK